MDKTATVGANPTHDADYQVEVDRYIVELKLMQQQASSDWRRMERMRDDTQMTLKNINAVLDKLSKA